MLNRIFILSVGCFLLSCASWGPMESRPLDPLYTYKADIILTVYGVSFDGFASGRLQKEQDIVIQSKASLNLLQISSCHRSFSIENVDKDWFGGVGHTYTYHYSPNELESNDFCPLYIQAFDTNGSTGWGFVAFQTRESLPFTFQCNGKTKSSQGLGICQSGAGQIQGVDFPEAVDIKISQECKLEESKEQKSFVISASGGFCLVTAKLKSDPSKFARVLLLGFKHQHVR